MKQSDIQFLLLLEEGQSIEFKADCLSVDSVGRAVCGMLNSSGGYVVCGVSPDNIVVGINLKDGLLAKFEKQLHDGLSPKSLVSV